MPIPDSHADLLQGRIGSLATVGRDGVPQVTAIAFALQDDGCIHTSINTERQKYRNLVVNPVATLHMIDPTNPWRTIEIRGTVELVPDPDKSWTKAFLQGAVDVDAIDGSAKRVQLILTPTKINTHG
jgi:PPOX class probable F420-dependent enzyme